MNPYFRKAVSRFLAGTLSVAMLATTINAETWYVEDGDITVSATESGQTVTQGGETNQETTDTVITNRNDSAASNSTITIKSSGNAQAQITLKDVDLNKGPSEDKAAVEISDGSNVQINLEGDNRIYTANGKSAVHVADGDLTITSQSSGKLNAIAVSRDTDGLEGYMYESSAAIGSDHHEDMSGSITVGGNAQVKAKTENYSDSADSSLTGDADGAGIGSGSHGDLTGSIHITDKARVAATSELDGAGIGSGYDGDMSGNINIDRNAEVNADSDKDGAGIGSGLNADMTGSIHIGDSAKVTASSDEDGAGIGSGNNGHLSGSITVDGSTEVNATSRDDGAGIGSGDDGHITENGSISIGGNAAVTALSKDDGAGIGSGNDGNVFGSIHIGGSAKVNADSDEDGAGIGAGDDGDMDGNIHIGGNSTVDADSDGDGAGIGSGYDGDMSGNITIDGSAKVNATSDEDGAGIGSGDDGNMYGSITIDGSAVVNATSDEDGAGIGAGDDGDIKKTGSISIGGNSIVKALAKGRGAGIGSGWTDDVHGSISIGGNAAVIAVSTGEGAGIGASRYGDITGNITIDGSAKVVAASQESAGIGSGINGFIKKNARIRIAGHAHVAAFTGSNASAAIGAPSITYMPWDDPYETGFSGTIEILDAANIITGVLDEDGNLIKNNPGIIGGGGIEDKNLEHLNELTNYGSIVLSSGARINGVLCSSYQDTSKWVRVPTDKNGLPRNLTFIPYVTAENTDHSQGLLLYWVTADGKPLAAESLTENGTLTVSVPEKDAELNMTAGGLALLKAMGIKTLVFTTADHSSTVKLQDLIDLNAASLQLKHEGGKASLLADGKEVKDLVS